MNHVHVLLFMTVDFFDSPARNLFQEVFLSLQFDLDFNSNANKFGRTWNLRFRVSRSEIHYGND